MSQNQHAKHKATPKVATLGLNAAVNILGKWGCSPDQEKQILGIDDLIRYKDLKTINKNLQLTDNQLKRIACILNIHATLRKAFDNPANVYGFMSMVNKHQYFNGARPLDIISTGHLDSLYETSKRIESILYS